MSGLLLRSWVAFNADGFPFGFMTVDDDTPISAVAREFPHAVRIELAEGERRSELLRIHAGLT
jgi:hypothetical protein